MLNSANPNQPLHVARIGYMWDQQPGGATFHAHIFCRGTNTILGETADPRELFEADICENCPLGSIVRKAKVSFSFIGRQYKISKSILVQTGGKAKNS